jgi:MarR family 2-MHQ and catechol resistance regulon transcriptional repressor
MTTGPRGATVWLTLWKTADAVGDHARRDVARQGLCYTDFAVLEAVLHKGPLPVNVIGKLVLLTSGAITAAIDRLEARGLVERRPDPSDRRTRIVGLTAAGRDFMLGIWAEHERALEGATEALDPTERRDLIRLLLKLKRGASAGDTVAIRGETPKPPQEGST